MQSVLWPPLLTMTARGELVALSPAVSMALAMIVCGPFETFEVSSGKVQLDVPEARAKAPLSMETLTAERLTLSEAVPETVTEPERVAPLEGEEIETEGDPDGAETLMDSLAEAACEAASLTCSVKAEVPAPEGVPEMVPDVLNVRPDGREPLITAQEYGGVPPLAVAVAVKDFAVVPPGRLAVVICKGGTILFGELESPTHPAHSNSPNSSVNTHTIRNEFPCISLDKLPWRNDFLDGWGDR